MNYNEKVERTARLLGYKVFKLGEGNLWCVVNPTGYIVANSVETHPVKLYDPSVVKDLQITYKIVLD